MVCNVTVSCLCPYYEVLALNGFSFNKVESNGTYPRKEKKELSLLTGGQGHVASHQDLTERLMLYSLAALIYRHLHPKKRSFQVPTSFN